MRIGQLVRLDWSAITGYAISGAIVSWPVFIIGLVIGHRKARQHVDQVTEQQTSAVRKITENQTTSLVRRLSRAYQQYAPREQGPAGQEDHPGEAPAGGQGDHPRDPGDEAGA